MVLLENFLSKSICISKQIRNHRNDEIQMYVKIKNIYLFGKKRILLQDCKIVFGYN